MSLLGRRASPLILCANNGQRQVSAHSSSAQTMDATTTKLAHRFKALRTGTIRKVTVYVVGVTSAQSLTVGLQDVDLTTGNPDGTFDASGTIGTPAAATYYEVDFGGSGKAVTAGDHIAVVVEWTGTTGTLTMSLAGNAHSTQSVRTTYASAAWSRNANAQGSLWCVCEYDDGIMAFCDLRIGTTGAATFATVSSSTTPDECGLKFTPAFNMECLGFFVQLGTVGTTNPQFKLYDANDVVLASGTIDKDVFNNTVNSGPCDSIILSAPIILKEGNVYRLVASPSDTQSFRQYYDTTPSAAFNTWYCGYVDQACWTERTDAGAWTDTTTRMPRSVAVLVAPFSGVMMGAGMRGGFNG